jgi:hypothetical protein
MAPAIEPRCRVRIDGLKARPDLNGTEGEALSYHADAGRWGVKCDAGGELVRVREANLTVVAAAPAEEVAATAEEEESGVYVKAHLNGKQVALDPGHLKRQFQAIVKKYHFDTGKHSDEIADFLTSDAASTVTPAEFAARFGTTEADASTFLAWINVGVAFKEQYMDPHQQQADEMSSSAARAKADRAGIV